MSNISIKQQSRIMNEVMEDDEIKNLSLQIEECGGLFFKNKIKNLLTQYSIQIMTQTLIHSQK